MINFEPTGRRTDDGTWWRKTFGNNWVGLFWGQPIVRLTEDFTVRLPNGVHFTIPKGYEWDRGTAPGLFGLLVKLLAFLRLIKATEDVSAIVHDRQWQLADQLPILHQATGYAEADKTLLKLMMLHGQPRWYAVVVYKLVRLVAHIKLKARGAI